MLLLQKGVTPYEYIDSPEKVNKTLLPEKEDFNLNVEDITDANYVHVKRVSKDFEIKQIRRISWFVRLN